MKNKTELTNNEKFENIADAFYKDTGMMAPGKDDWLCSNTPEERIASFDKWHKSFSEEEYLAITNGRIQ